MLFGFTPVNNDFGEFWDWTTFALRNGLKNLLRDGMNYLDMGTGPYGILALYAYHRLNVGKITACDHIGELVESAKKQNRSAKIYFIKSDLFAEILQRFDFITFNAPYMAYDWGKKMDILKDAQCEARWSGGEYEIAVISKFLCLLPKYMADNGVCLLGVNHFHVSPQVIMNEINRFDLRVSHRKMNPITRSCIYVIMAKQAS